MGKDCSTKPTLGCIGPGAMGSRMTTRLLDAGYRLMADLAGLRIPEPATQGAA